MREIQILDASCLALAWSTRSQLSASQFAFARAFALELSTTGLCGLASTPVTLSGILELEALAGEFFSRPGEEKAAVSMARQGSAWRGYFETGDELTAGVPDVKEGLYFGEEHDQGHPLVQARELMHGQNVWPRGELGESLKRAVWSHMQACGQLGQSLLVALAVGLELPETAFTAFLAPEPTTLFRIFHYPPRKEHLHLGSEWGVAEHTDMGFLTLLIQGGDETVLEAKSRAGEWLAVPPQKRVFYVNVGDMLEYLSQGLLWATPHRVRASVDKGRLSFPYFFDPAWGSRLSPLDANLLETLGWKKEDRITRMAQARWDSLVLHGIKGLTYGEFVSAKIRTVFPHLAGG